MMIKRLFLPLLPLILSLILIGPVHAESTRVLMTTTLGNIEIELNDEKAPATVKNFLRYVDEGFYSGTVFHRVINDFMIQGGGFTTDLDRTRGHAPVANEAKNGLSNSRGTLAMARTNAPHSATSQFFINHQDNRNLDYPSFDGWGYAVFGKVTQGMETVDRIADVTTSNQMGMQNVPVEPIVIESITRISN